MKIKIHPLFLIFCVILMLFGCGVSVAFSLLAVFLHELAHWCAARLKGFSLNEMVIMPYGAVMYGNEYLPRNCAVSIALAGPLANLALAGLTLGVWWLFPSTYSFTESFLQANLSLAFINLLPAFPLDGGRVALGLAKNQGKMLVALKIFGVVISLTLLGLFFASMFYEINFMLLMFAVFLFYGAVFGTQNETCLHLANKQAKSYGLGVTERTVKISVNAPLVRALRIVSQNFITTFVVVDKNGNELSRLSEEQMQELFLKNKLNDKLFKVLKISN